MKERPGDVPPKLAAEAEAAVQDAWPATRRKVRPRPKSLFLAQLLGKFRRLYLTTFRPDYVRTQVKRRSGRCMQCGACCRLACRCPHLTRDSLCRIYRSRRSASCTSFPIDERDLRELPAECGYRFSAPAGSERP